MLGIKYGETCALNFKCLDKNNNPIDMTDAKIQFLLQDEVDINEYVVSKEINADENENGIINNPTNGQFKVFFTEEDYEKLYKGRIYYLTIWFIKGSCKKIISSSGNDLCPFTIFYP